MTDLLVIGYGNDLRSDDGAGRRVADAVEARALAGVEVRSVSQLTPELSLDIARSRCVVFVDASVEVDCVTVETVDARPADRGVVTHHASPGRLLALVPEVGPSPAEAVAISIPARDFELGFDLSARTEAGVIEAVDMIVAMARA